jgi:hypothetical protein
LLRCRSKTLNTCPMLERYHVFPDMIDVDYKHCYVDLPIALVGIDVKG